MKCKKIICLLLCILLLMTQAVTGFGAVNDNARFVLRAGEIQDGKYSVVLVAENCLDLISADCDILYDSDVVEFVPATSYSDAQTMSDMLKFKMCRWNDFWTLTNIIASEGKVLTDFYFLDTLNPEASDVDVDIANAQILLYTFNVKNESVREVKLTLSVMASFADRSDLVFSEEFTIALPCNGNHIDTDFDAHCDSCGEECETSVEFVEGEDYTFGNYNYWFMENAFIFSGCEEYEKEITLPGYIYGYPVTGIRDCVLENEVVTHLNIPATVTDIAEGIVIYPQFECFNVAEDNSFYSSENGVLFNKNKTELISYPPAKKDASYTVPASVKNIKDGAFSYCKNLEELKLPDNLSFENGAYEIDFKIASCSALKEISVSENNKLLSSEDGVLYNKEKTELLLYPAKKADASFTVPDSVISVCSNSFCGNVLLKEVIMNDNVIEIGELAFSGCASLKKVTLPQVEGLYYGAFQGCEAIELVNYGGDMITWLGMRQWTLGNDCLLYADVICAKGTGISNNEDKVKELGENNLLVTNNSTVIEFITELNPQFESFLTTVYDAKGNEVDIEAKIGTGMKFVVKDGNDEILIERTVIVPCDIDGDAAASATDARLALRASVKLEKLNAEQSTAANVSLNSAEVTAEDARLILRTSVKLEDISAIFASMG